MNSAIPDSFVTGFESLIGGISLADSDDRHVVAAAVFSRAEVIVTFNLKDFPATSLQPLNVQAQHPDDFVLSLLDIDQNAVCEAARKQRANLKNPPKSVDQLLDGLEKTGLVKTVEFFRRRRPGDDFKGIINCDRDKMYWRAKRLQWCWSHLENPLPASCSTRERLLLSRL